MYGTRYFASQVPDLAVDRLSSNFLSCYQVFGVQTGVK